jgi:replicative DNA helicase
MAFVDQAGVWNLSSSADEAIKRFRTFDEGEPDLIPLGIPAVDSVIGGLFPGSCGVLGMATGVGKSSLMLTAALTSTAPIGIISCEDTPDVLGSRALAWASGVNSRKLRTKELTFEDRQSIEAGRTYLESTEVLVTYAVGAPADVVSDCVTSLAEAGCRLIWLDYLQKVRGVTDDRRNEVSRIYTQFQYGCARNDCAGMVISQFSRQDPTREPQIYWLKESGDIENEARLIILGHRDPSDADTVYCRVAKSTYGGENIRFAYRRNSAGILEAVNGG